MERNLNKAAYHVLAELREIINLPAGDLRLSRVQRLAKSFSQPELACLIEKQFQNEPDLDLPKEIQEA